MPKRKKATQPQPTRLTHDQRRQRRQKMAALVASGQTVERVARRFGVTVATVRSACKEQGVKL